MSGQSFLWTVALALAVLSGFGQQVTITGQGKNRNGLPLDNTVFVTVSHDQITDTVYCDCEGKFSIPLTNVANHSTIVVSGLQDWNKVKKFSTGEPCPIDYPLTPLYLGHPKQKIKINSDSTKNYIFNFYIPELIEDLVFPTIYFKTNDTMMTNAKLFFNDSNYTTADSGICQMKNIIKCHKRLVIEIVGYCSPSEKNHTTLSAQRAIVAYRQLISMGINPKRLQLMAGGAKSINNDSEWDDEPSTKTETKSIPDSEQQKVVFLVLRNDFKE